MPEGSDSSDSSDHEADYGRDPVLYEKHLDELEEARETAELRAYQRRVKEYRKMVDLENFSDGTGIEAIVWLRPAKAILGMPPSPRPIGTPYLTRP